MSTQLKRPRSKHVSIAPDSTSRFNVSKYIIGVVSAMAIVVPLLCGSSFLTNVGKVFAFEALGAVLISLMILTIRTEGLAQRLKENIMAGPNRLVLAFVLCSVLSFAIGPVNKWLTVHELVRVLVCAAVYFGVSYNLQGRLTLITDVILAAAAAVALFGLAGVGDHDLTQGGGITGPFGTHEALGSFLMLLLPITASVAIFGKKDDVRRLVALAVSLLVVVCLAFSQSRSGWMSELVALAVLAGLAARFNSAKAATVKQKFIVALPFAGFVGISGLMVAISGSGSDVQQRFATFGLGSADMSMHTRFQLWHAALAMLSVKPILGWGLGSFPYIASRFTSVAAPYSVVAYTGANLNNIAHNFYLQTLAETGVIGFVLYAATITAFFATGVRALATLKDGARKIVLIGVLAAMAGQVVDAITSPSYNIASISLFQWLLMGVGMYAAGVPVQQTETSEEPALDTGSVVLKLRRALAGAAAVVVCLSSIAVFAGTAGTAVADNYHHHGVTDTQAALWTAGGVGAGTYLGWWLAHHPQGGGGKGNGKGQDNGNGNGNGQSSNSGTHGTSYEDKAQIDARVNAEIDAQYKTQ